MKNDMKSSGSIDEKPIDKRKFFRWVKRRNPDHFDLLNQCVIRLAETMEPFGFRWVDISTDVGPVLGHIVSFEKKLPERRFSYVMICFDHTGKLTYLVDFAVKQDHEPFQWLRAGYMSKLEEEDSSDVWWGPRWYHFDKRKIFRASWDILLGNVPQIVDFLQNGNEHLYVWKSKYVVDQM